MPRVLLGCLTFVLACRSPQEQFPCTESAQCTLGGDQGVCETTGFCSFASTTCPSGRSYGDGAPEALRDKCVGTTTGTIGDWRRWGTGAPAASHAHARAGNADHLFLLGGRDPNDVYRMDMWSASIATGNWVPAAIPATRGASAAVASGSYLYLLGGRNNDVQGAGLSNVWYASVDAAGTPIAWTETEGLCAPRYGLSAVVAGGHLYAFGGSNDQMPVTTTSCFTTIDPGTGALAAWSETTALPVAMRNPLVVATDDHVFVIGGCTDTIAKPACNGTGGGADVYAAAVLADGHLGDWVMVSTLPEAAFDRGATIYDGRIYIVGGAVGAMHTDHVWTALVEYGGQLGPWTSATAAHVVSSGTNPHRRPGVTAAAGQLYVFQYDNEVNETITAPLQ